MLERLTGKDYFSLGNQGTFFWKYGLYNETRVVNHTMIWAKSVAWAKRTVSSRALKHCLGTKEIQCIWQKHGSNQHGMNL